MNKNLYTDTMNKIFMDENCENEILDSVNSEIPVPVKKKAKIRFVPVLAAAAIVLTCGTWAAAESSIDWFKSIFSDSSDIEITEFEEGLISEMTNFGFQSTNENISFEPVGMLADEQDVYCVIRPVGTEIDEIHFISLYSDCFNQTETLGSTSSCRIDEETGNIIVAFSLTDQSFTDGHNVSIFLSNYDSAANTENQDSSAQSDIENVWTYCVNPYNTNQPMDLNGFTPESEYDIYRIDFTAEFGDTKTVTIDSFTEDTPFSIDKIVVTPLSIAAYNHLTFSGTGFTVVMDDGSTADSADEFLGSGGFAYAGGATVTGDMEYTSCLYEQFSKPINPENVAQIYIDNQLVYQK